MNKGPHRNSDLRILSVNKGPHGFARAARKIRHFRVVTVGKTYQNELPPAREARPKKNSTFKVFYSAKTFIFLLSQTHVNKGPHRIRGNLVK